MRLPDQHAWAIVSALQGIKLSESKRAALCRHVVESLPLEVTVGAGGGQQGWRVWFAKPEPMGAAGSEIAQLWVWSVSHGSILNLQTFLLKRAPKMPRCSWKWLVLARWLVDFF